jgi:cytochrome c-type biogenesis protein CcmH
LIGFSAIALAMTLAALLCVAWPLARRMRAHEPAAAETNLAILRDELRTLEEDLARGAISKAQFDVARIELERRVLEEAVVENPPGKLEPHQSSRKAALTLALLIPVAAIAMYAAIGNVDGMRKVERAAEQVSAADVEAMVGKLADRLKTNPDDVRGWMLLGRSYYVLQRMDEAVAAYAKAAEKITDDADFFADYADAVAMSHGRNLTGKPIELARRALAINPAHPKALAMAGTEAFQRNDYPAAANYWEKLLPMLPPDSDIAKSIAGGIAEARELGTAKAAPATAGKAAAGQGISGQVILSPSLAAKADPQETLFIVARAVNGPRMPLAVIRKRVADLPLEFTLDDSMAMSPELKLSGAAEVVVTARISRSGDAIPRAGDLQGTSPPVKAGSRGLKIVIDSALP